jgi:cyclic pyranopterin phosphate synthase
VIRGYNDDELAELIEFGRRESAELRFIEYMDVGGATRWSAADVVTRQEMLARIETTYGPIEPLMDRERPSAPAERFRLADGTVFGIIASTTAPFCGDCDRARLTADGQLLLCLYAETGLDLRAPLRARTTDEELSRLIGRVWRARRDRGAEDRLALSGRGALYSLSGLQEDPHREMHTRGG